MSGNVNSDELENLKDNFKKKCIPLEGDFIKLIDLVSMGPELGDGLARSADDEVLEISLAIASGLKGKALADNTLGLSCACNGGMTTENGPLAVQCGNEFDLNNSGLSLKLFDPLNVTNEELSVKLGKGLSCSDTFRLDLDCQAFRVDENGVLHLRCKENGGLKIVDGCVVIDMNVT
ncbi:hypothetical protein [Burkholderia sp. SIMBA_062]|uniref:hypothetical protein n=1 Tax=Burkholderia sp. SIMBA_062 TaxID=3085803 RepID=UPI00397814D3